MTEKQLREALRNCLPDSLPEAQQRAVLSRIRERKQPMKRKVSLALVLTLVLLALGAVAYAVVSRYSVADYSGAGQMTEELQNSIVDIDETYENAYMTMTANDVLYDGETVTMAFNFTTKDPDMHLYLYPRLTAEVDGQTYVADVESFGAGDFMSGFVYPFLPGHDLAAQGYGFGLDAVLLDDDCNLIRPAGEVRWTLTMKVFKPNFEVEYADVVFDGTESEEEMQQKMDVFAQAFREHKILVTNDTSLAEWDSQIPIPDGMTEEEWYGMEPFESLTISGAYDLMDVVKISFTTQVPENAVSQTGLNLTVPTEKGPLTLEELSVSFQTVSFRLSLPMEEGETENDLWEQVWQYLKIYPDGNDTPCGEDSTWYEKQENPDGTFRCVLAGQRRLNDGVTPERLTFDVGGARFTVSVPEMALVEENAGA